MSHLPLKKSCTGCTACFSICPVKCIEMKEDKYGFYYPNIDTSRCIECKNCEKVCSVINHFLKKNDLLECYAVYSSNSIARKNSSSGGVFFELAKKILEYCGIVYGAAYDETFSVCHKEVNSLKELELLQGAKYSESRLDDCFKKVENQLEKGLKVLFSGTPCQVEGLKRYLKKDFDNLYTVDFICHGVPSPMSWESYVKYRAFKDNGGNKPLTINLRSKNTGWSRYQYSVLFEYKNGIKYTVRNTEDLFMRLFIGDYINRDSCATCKFKGVNRISDFTIGDFWGVWDIYPEMDDNKGTSAVLIHTKKGKLFFEEIQACMTYKKVSEKDIIADNIALIQSFKTKRKKKDIMKFVHEDKWECIERIIEGRTEGRNKLLKKGLSCIFRTR